ncbi:MAG: hypothetical protein AABW85_04060 [archaeon]|mgnify:CR=1 FL=1
MKERTKAKKIPAKAMIAEPIRIDVAATACQNCLEGKTPPECTAICEETP